MDSLKCSKCSKIFGYKCNLTSHEKTCKGIEENKFKKKIKCPLGECGQVVSDQKLLRQHVEYDHNVSFNEEQHHFHDLNEFKKWKENVEKSNVCMYVSRTSAKTKNGKRTYYHCHRSGYFRSRSKGKRRIKSQGSNKIDSICTSSMVVTQSPNGNIDVSFCATHFGHGSNLGRF